MASELEFDSYGFLNDIWDLNQTNWSDYFYPVIPDGVIGGVGLEMKVYAESAGMRVYVRSGECRIRSHRGLMRGTKYLTVAAADETNPRIDLVVARVKYRTSEVTLAIKEGTPSQSPTVPAITQTAGDVWEIPLGTVYVGAGVVTITADDVKDYRNVYHAGGIVQTHTGVAINVLNQKEYRLLGDKAKLTITLPNFDPPDTWICAVNFTSGSSFTGVTFMRDGETYSPKAVGDTLNLVSRRYNLVIWWDGAYFWVSAKAL